MIRILSTLLAKSVGALRGIADLHPAVFSFSDWSAPQSPGGVQQRHRTAELHATEPESSLLTPAPPAGWRPTRDRNLPLSHG